MSNVWDNVRSENISSNNTTSNNKSSTIWSSIRNTNNTNTNTWFKKTNGNVIQNIAGTIGDVGINTYKGFFNTIEGGVDAGEYNLSDIMNKFGNKKAADYLKWSASVNSTGSLLGENENNKENLFENKTNITKKVDNYSILGDKSDSIVQGVGNVAAFAGLSALAGGAVGAAGKSLGAGSKVIEGAKVGTNALNTFSSAYGNARSQAYNDGADEKTAKTTAFISGLSEAISEQFFDAIPGVKSVGLGDKISSGVGSTVEKVLKNQQAGKIAVKIMGSIGEGSEEIISNVLQATGNDIAHKLDNNYTYGMEDQTGNVLQDMFTSATSEASREAFISAAISSAIVNGGNTMINQQQKNKAISAYAKDNNITFEQSKTKLNEFYNENLKQIQQENPNPTYKENLDQQEEAQYNANQQLLKDKTLKKAQAYTYKETGNEKVDTMYKSLSEVGNNTTESHEKAKLAEKMINDLGYDVEFTNNEKIFSEMSEEQKAKYEGKTINGFVKDGKMYLNVDSNNLASFTIGHETKHFFEKFKEENKSINDALIEFAKLNNRYDTDLAETTKMYTDKDGNVLGDPEGELMADYTAEFFTNEDFVNSLSSKNPTLLSKARTWFKELYYKATGQQEKLLLSKINTTIENAYRKMAQNKTNNSNMNTLEDIPDREIVENKANTETKQQEEVNLPTMIETTSQVAETKASEINLPSNIQSNVKNNQINIKNAQNKENIVKSRNETKYSLSDTDNTNPTSNQDIRYSLSEDNNMIDDKTGKKVMFDVEPIKTPLPVNDDNKLMAIHNLSEEKMKGVIELGGFPVPSIAVTNPDIINHESFGDISVIFDKSTIDPSNRKNEVYDRDVWSPTQPQIDYYMDSETLKNVANKLGIRDYVLEDYADNNKTPQYLSDRLTRVDEIVNKYVEDNNVKYETAYKSPEMEVEFHELSNDIRQFIIDNDLTVYKLAQDENLKNEYYKLIKDYYDNANISSAMKENLYNKKINFLNEWINTQKGAGDLEPVRGMRRYQDDFDLIKKGENQVVDEWQTQKNKREAAIANGLQDYLIEETAPLFKEKGIYNGKEYLTASGIRRSFWQLHDEYNLENIVDAMTAGDTKGTQNWSSGFGQIRAQMANRFNSIEEIRNAENQIMADANNTRLVELREKLENDIDNLSDKYDGWGGMEIASELIADFASQSNHDIETFRDLLENNYQAFGRITDNEINQIIDHLEELRELPTDYFEAKPQRAVGLNEIGIEIIPNTSSEEFKKLLQDNGIEYAEYDKSIEGDRQRVINEYQQYKFSLSNKGEEYQPKLYKGNDTTKLSDMKLQDKVNLPTNDDVLTKQYGTTLKDLQVDKSVLPFTSGSSNDITSQESALNNPNVLYQYDNGGNITEEDKQKRAEKLINDKISNNSIANIENTSKVVKNTLELTNNERNDFLSQINKYFGMTREEIENSDAKDIIKNFVKDHSTIEYEHTYTDDLLDEVKQAIRGYKITLGDSFKGYNEKFFGKTHKVAGELSDGITDFKKNNPGLNVSYGNNENIDVIWQELHSRFPSYFDEDVNDKDMLFQMASLLKKDSTKTEIESYNLDEKDINDYSNKIYHSMFKNSLTDEELKTYISGIQDKINNKYARQMSVDGYRQYTYEFTKDLSQVKDKKAGISYKINTMKRNLRDIMSKQEATKWYNAFFKPVTENNARIEIAKQYYVDKISKYKLNEQESSYVQMVGEKESNPDTTLTNDVIDKFYKKNENKIDKAKCESAVIEFRNVYDELINKVNSVLKANGYKTIDYRKGYFPHFIEEKNKNIIQKMAEKFLGWKTQNQNLPTDIAGITDTFKPGKVWTSFSQRRTGDYTDYNALKGMDNYLNGAMDVIFHTQDIQKLRALENQIRYQYSDSGVQAKINEIYHDPNLSIEEKNQQIEYYTDSITNNPLGNLVTELRNYTNNLANKKSFSDRSMEQSLGRNTYTIMKNINGRVSANMVGMNISSAMTNFIPITQAWGECSTKNIMRGIKEATINNIKDDGFSDSSVYLTNRTKQANKLYKTAIDKVSDFTSLPFEAVDSFTSNVIVRAKYYDNIDKGMNNIEAMNDADEYAKDIMAGRSKGDQPTIFNTQNPISKLFTAFQLEVNNQYGYMLKDLPVNVGKDAFDKLALAFLKMFLGAFLYNQVSQKLTGRKSAFSPIDIVEDDVINGENKDIATKIKDIADNIPFVGGVMGGGRLPISSAIPFQDLSKAVTSTASDISDIRSNDESKKKAAINELISEWSRPLYYLALPFGGGQLKKTVEGLSMYDSNLPINGSYNKNGELKYEADNSTAGKIKAAIFGKNSTKNANEYYDNGYKPLNEKQIQTIKDSNISVSEYRNIQTELKNKSTSEKIDYISNLPLEDNQKNVLVNSISNRKEQLDVSNYNDYGSYDEFIYSSQNPEKYKTIKSITDYSSYTNYDKDISAIKTNATDKNTRKEEVFNYINKLSLNKYQKLMLYKEAGGYSIKNYKNEMFNYINSMELSKTDKETIYNELFS